MSNLEDIPEPSFTPQGRKFEYQIVEEIKKGIIASMKLSKESKLIQIRLWDSYLIQYENLYQRYRKEK